MAGVEVWAMTARKRGYLAKGPWAGGMRVGKTVLELRGFGFGRDRKQSESEVNGYCVG